MQRIERDKSQHQVHASQSAMENTPDIPDLIEKLGSDLNPVQKKSAYTLSSNVGDPAFAEVFISEGGLVKLKELILKTNGNTLAYSLKALDGLLEVDKGWECMDQELLMKVCIYASGSEAHGLQDIRLLSW